MTSETLVLGIAAISLAIATVYYAVIVAGWYKGPMLVHFRAYGQETLVYPFPRCLRLLGMDCVVVSIIFPVVILPLIAMGIIAWVAAWTLDKNDRWRGWLPRWYAKLLQDASRVERRAIAYAWLRLPFRTRLRLNSDGYAFQIFMDEVRLTVIYGARDRDDPWRHWS